MERRLDWLVLSRIPGIGVTTFWQLVNHFGSPTQVLANSPGALKRILSGRALDGITRLAEIRTDCQQELMHLRQMGGHLICCEDDEYPPLLKEIQTPPPVLSLLGRKELLSTCSLAMVGSRAATRYGLNVSSELAAGLTRNGFNIVSGLALGIDSAAHDGALRAGGGTVAVLGCGVDVVYPRQNRMLYERIRDSGALISEYALGTAPEGFRFPARNRIIAGMSRGVLVVEAARQSGSLITAQFALDEGRDVYAVPGRVDSCKSDGTHWLLQQGAKLVCRATDVLEDQDVRPSGADTADADEEQAIASLGYRERKLLACLDVYPVARDSLLGLAGLDIADLGESLLLLELEGLIEILPGDEIRRLR